MDELVPAKKFQYTLTGIEFDPQLTFEEWAAIGGGLLELHYMTPIRIGIWLCEGERRWGETFAQAVDITHLSVDTLAHYKSTMSRVPAEVRQPGLTLSHYRTVAALPLEDQKKYLDEAHANNLSVRELNSLVAAEELMGKDHRLHGMKAKIKLRPHCAVCGAMDVPLVTLCHQCKKGDHQCMNPK